MRASPRRSRAGGPTTGPRRANCAASRRLSSARGRRWPRCRSTMPRRVPMHRASRRGSPIDPISTGTGPHDRAAAVDPASRSPRSEGKAGALAGRPSGRHFEGDSGVWRRRTIAARRLPCHGGGTAAQAGGRQRVSSRPSHAGTGGQAVCSRHTVATPHVRRDLPLIVGFETLTDAQPVVTGDQIAPLFALLH